MNSFSCLAVATLYTRTPGVRQFSYIRDGAAGAAERRCPRVPVSRPPLLPRPPGFPGHPHAPGSRPVMSQGRANKGPLCAPSLPAASRHPPDLARAEFVSQCFPPLPPRARFSFYFPRYWTPLFFRRYGEGFGALVEERASLWHRESGSRTPRSSLVIKALGARMKRSCEKQLY